MNINIDKLIPRKLSIALFTIYILKDIVTSPIIVVCITVIATVAMYVQYSLDKEKQNGKKSNNSDVPAGNN